MKRGEECTEAGEDKDGHDENGYDRHNHDDGRVDERPGELSSGLGITFDVFGELIKDVVEVPREFRGVEHADVKLGEGFGMAGGRAGEGVAACEGFDHLRDHDMKPLVGDLLVDDFQGLENRYSGLD